MKKILSIAFIAATLIACNVTTDTTMTTTMPEPVTDNTATAPAYTPANGDVLMRDGKLMMMQDGNMKPMDHDMTFGNGTQVMRNGDLKMRNGKMSRMEEGATLSSNGTLYDRNGRVMQDNAMTDQVNDTTRM